jgi:hypothetical protein
MKPTTHKPTPPTKATREAYVSMDREERDILRTLGLRERALYPELKWLASFKTGEVKHFGKRVITFQFLANLITVPTTQGRAADTMNAKEACRVLMRLHDAGLVGEIENDPKKGLRFALPMSPICKQTALKLRLAAMAQEQSGGQKLPNAAHAETAQNIATMRAGEGFESSLSVMTFSEGEQYDFHTDISNLAAVHGTAPARSSVAVAHPNQIFVPAEPEPRGATTDVLSVEAIKERLRGSKSAFSWIDHAESGQMYRRWVAARHSVERFEAAVCAVEDDFNVEPTPRAIDGELRNGGARNDAMLRAEQRARRRRGVAL